MRLWIHLAGLAATVVVGSFQIDRASQNDMPQDTIRAFHRIQQESPLHQRAIDSGGTLHQICAVTPANLLNDLASMMRDSDDVVLVSIFRNSCQVSPSGEDPVTFYDAVVLDQWKGTTGDLATLSVPMGMVAFDRDTRAATSIPGFRPLQNGGRYVLFLRFARGDEKQLTPALRLVGDGVQGAFELSDEKVYPAYRLDSVAPKYEGFFLSQFLDEVQSLTTANGQQRGPSAAPTAPRYDGQPWEFNAGYVQSVGLHLPSYMPTLRDLTNYDRNLPVHQLLTIEWDPHTGYDHVVRRNQVAEGSLTHDFKILDRKRNVGRVSTSTRDALGDMVVEVLATTTSGEVRGWSSGPTLVIRPDLPPIPGRPPQEGYEYIGSKMTFQVGLPDDPKIAKLVFLLAHPEGEKYRFEQVGVIEFAAQELK